MAKGSLSRCDFRYGRPVRVGRSGGTWKGRRAMAEDTWNQARLIPTSGIRDNSEEQERRGTSALLAVMTSVKEFGRALTERAGAPAGRVETYIEVPFVTGGQRVYPDGLIRVNRGKRSWTALVEVKTGRNELRSEQLETYLDVVRDEGFDALITISNEIPSVPGQHPTKIDKRRLKKVTLQHFAWSEVLTEAIIQKEHRGVADADQGWILGELIRYLEHKKSGALEFSSMGSGWVAVLAGAKAGTLRAADDVAIETAARFDALLRYVGLKLGRQLGQEVTMAISRAEVADPARRAQALTTELTTQGILSGALRIPDTIGHLVVTADLKASIVRCHVTLDAPKQGKAVTRVKWLVRQLPHAPDQTCVEALYFHQRGQGDVQNLALLRETPETLVADPKRDLRGFRVSLSRPMGLKNGTGRGTFIDSIEDATNGFYADIIERLKAWRASPPLLRKPQPDPRPPVEPSLVSTDLSSQDGVLSAASDPPEQTSPSMDTAL
jgi:hypothetical protein